MLDKIKNTFIFIISLLWVTTVIVYFIWAIATSSSAGVEYPEDYMNDYGNSKIGN